MLRSYSDMTLPDWPNNIGKVRNIRSINGDPIQFIILDEILYPETNFPQKLICLQRVQMRPGGIALRLGYYILGQKEKRRGMWVWGQYAPFLDPANLSVVIEKARLRGWFNWNNGQCGEHQ